MKIIDRKALLAALIMTCGNGVLASGMDLPGGDGSGDDGRGGKKLRTAESTNDVRAGLEVGGGAGAPAAERAAPITGSRKRGKAEEDDAPAGAGGAGVAPRRQAGFVVANLWAARMEKTWGEEKRLLDSIVAAIQALPSTIPEDFTLPLERFTHPELSRIQSLLFDDPRNFSTGSFYIILQDLAALDNDQRQAVYAYVAKFFTEELDKDTRFVPGRNLLLAIKGIDADEIRARAQAIETHAERLIPEEGIPDRHQPSRKGLLRAETLAFLMRLTVDQINAIGEHPIILLKELCKKNIPRIVINRVLKNLTPGEIRDLKIETLVEKLKS